MSETTLHQLKTIGAVGVLLKQSALPELESCLTQVVAGQSYTSALCYEAVGTSAGEVRAEPAPQKPPRLHLLTATERQVLRLIAQHKTTAEIAELLFNSVRTIEKHRANIGKKLGIEGNNSLLTFALTHRYWLE